MISLKEKKELQASNKELKEIVASQNKQLAIQNEQIAMQNKRLETLERIALGNSQAKDIASKF